MYSPYCPTKISQPYISRIAICLLWCLLTACNENTNISPSKSFNKIYNESSFSDFQAIDVVQTQDEGYIILGTIENSFAEQNDVPYILRIDKEGNYLWDTKLDKQLEAYISPIPNLKANQGNYHFFCFKKEGLKPALLKINDESKKVEEVRVYGQMSGDLAYVSDTQDNGMLLTLLSESCNPDNDLQTRNIELFKLSPTFDIQWRNCYPYSIFVPRDPVSRRVNYNFFINGNFNASGREYFFTTFLGQDNSTILIFTDHQGKVQGEARLPFVINSMAHINNNQFAMTFVKQKDLNIMSNAVFNLNSQTSPNLIGSTFHEINSQARAITKKMTLANKEVTIIASTLENIPIRIYAFDAKVTTTDLLRGSLTLGRGNPYEIADVIPSADGGLTIVANTLVGDRFKRIAVLKVSATDTNNFVNSCLSTGTCNE
ncbi:MAG: hypothetical protein MUE81_06790 [Thermoflexibacter sp.]|jgi:hypothetical protein|nr:hypothetical protein [Thermoflexibacter sp.]